ncbi:MAG: glycine zipper 2TM domain-containing protein [Proteobacteria bacterium]|nr:glycine zipper 2TM domain-containing protein [Pseudomonadota bacterium]
MKQITIFISFLFILGINTHVFAECTPQTDSGTEIFSTLAGAALGGLVGSQIGGGTGKKVAIGAGVVAGGFLGNKVGTALDCQDQQYHYDTTQNALETKKTGQSSNWVNPDTGHSGEITPTRTYTSDDQPCRDYTQTIYIDGKAEEVNGTACRQEDGSWKPLG